MMFRAALALVIIGSLCSPVRAGIEDCQTALDELRSAKERLDSARSDASEAASSYQQCLEDSHGPDDCDIERSTLESARDDFETAKSEYDSARSDYGLECGH
jgi:hypothetical protein